MTVKAPPVTEKSRPQFKRRLARRTVVQLLLLTMIPFLALGGFAVLRLRSQLTQQISTQVRSISSYYAEQLNELAKDRGDSLSELIYTPRVFDNMSTVIESTARNSEYFQARFSVQGEFFNYTTVTEDQLFDQLFVLRPDGTVAFSTNTSWEDQQFSDYPYIGQFMDSDNAELIFNPEPLYSNQFVMITSRIIRNENGQHIGTVYGTTLTNLPWSLLTYAETLLPSARSYYFTNDQNLIGFEPGTKNLHAVELTDSQRSSVQGLIELGSNQLNTIQSAITNVESFALAKQVKELQTYLIFSIPTSTIYSQIQVFSPATIAIFFAAIALIGFLIYLGANRIVKPLEGLSAISQQFARGDWSQRAVVNRDDELGQLAFSYNQMADELQDVYNSLEAKVEQRSHQLRTASEVALLATSGTNRDEMIQQAVDLLKDRFEFFYSAIYLIDETGDYANLRATSTTDEELIIPNNLRIPVGSKTVVGQVAATQTPIVISNLDEEHEYQQSASTMIGSMSEATAPMLLGNQLVGLIDIQSRSLAAFDSDTLSVLQTLASQLATGLRNVLLVESSQVNLEETAMLYRSSRQITQAKTEAEVLQTLTETLNKTNFLSLVLTVEEDSLKVISFGDPKASSVGSAVKGISLPMQRGAARLKDNAILILENLQASNDFENLTAFLTRRSCRSAALIPILENGRPTKLIALGTRESTPLSSSRLQPYASLAEVASTAFERFTVLQTLQDRLSELQVMEYVGHAVTAETDPEQLYKTLHDVISDQMGSDLSFAVALFNASTNQIEFPYMIDVGKQMTVPPLPLGEGMTSEVVKKQKPLLINNNLEEAAQRLGAKLVGQLPKSWLGIPLVIAGNSIGAILLQDMENENRFSQTDVNLLNTISPQIATAIRNSQLLAEMAKTTSAYEQEHFLLDSLLTSLPDRVAFKDADLRYLRVSEIMAKDYGFRSASHFIGKDDAQIMGSEIGQQALAEERQILESGQPVLDTVEKTVDDHGNENWRVSTKLPMVDASGQPVGLLGISRDITAVKKTEEIAQLRSQRLLTAAEIARDTSGLLDLEVLLKNAVNLVLDRFGFYHASIFLLDPLGEYAILRESTGDAGARMKGIGHKLAVGSSSIVGQATSRGEPLVVNEVRKFENYYPNPLLPDTRAEMAIPLKMANRTLGALDVQSTKTNAFTQEDVQTLQILADQLAIAIINAELYTSTQETLAQHRFLHQISAAASSSQNVDDALRTTAQGMQVARKEDRVSIHIMNNRGELLLAAMAGYPAGQRPAEVIPMGEGIIGRVAIEKRPSRVADVLTDPYYVPTDDAIRSELAVPIIYTDRLLGVLNLESEKVAAYNENDEEILSTMAANLGSIIANAQLVSQVQHQVERQQQIFEITSKIRRSVDMKSILETSTSELCKALRAQKATIRLTVDSEESPVSVTQEAHSNHNGHDSGSKSNGKGAK